jgi:NAD(P)-dependent dehydrogenase (short-subunit alcohol dehydrogenase family)
MSKNALVVGGTSGIGRGLAEFLARGGYAVTIAGRNELEGASIVNELHAMSPSASGAKHSFQKVDGFDLSSVAELAKSQAAKGLDCLVLTQGMATIQGFTPTKDGLDQKLSLHFYSRLVLAQLLAPTLAKSPDGGRVLSVLAAGVHSAYAGYESDPTLEKSYSVKNAADAACLYNDVAMHKLSIAFPTVSFTHAAPGFVSTNWGTEMPFPIRWAVRALQVFGVSRATCAQRLGDPWLQLPAGFHLMGQGGQPVSRTSEHEKVMASGFWDHTQALLKKWLA